MYKDITAMVQVRDNGDTGNRGEGGEKVWEIWAEVKLAELGDHLDMKNEREDRVKDDS